MTAKHLPPNITTRRKAPGQYTILYWGNPVGRVARKRGYWTAHIATAPPVDAPTMHEAINDAWRFAR